jgi:thiamine pyrophosphokinase
LEPDLGNAGVGKKHRIVEQEPPAKGQAVRLFSSKLAKPGISAEGEGTAMRAIIVASGQTNEDTQWRRWAQDTDLIIGADGGAARALAWGLQPHLVIGDMDSLPDEAQGKLTTLGCRFVEHPRAKDETDLELALTHAAEAGVQEIVILGALGGRLDHTLANVLLLTLPQLTGLSVRIVNGDEEALVIRGGETVTLEGQQGDLVSLLPLGGDACGVTTTGLTWPLQGDILRFGFSRGVSNVMAEAVARIKLERGYLMVIHAIGEEKQETSD